jgi:hypothetical protein
MRQRGVPRGLLDQICLSTIGFASQRLEMYMATRTTAWAGIDIGKPIIGSVLSTPTGGH